MAFFNTLRVAGITPSNINIGSLPTHTRDNILARTRKLYFFTASALANNTAPAPSVICDAFPAVTTPFFLNTVFNLFNESRFGGKRIPSSSYTCFTVSFFVFGSLVFTLIGVICKSDNPLFRANPAL